MSGEDRRATGQQRRTTSTRDSQAPEAPRAVDWTKIEQQLNNIPSDFKSQKFNSLKRVIEILSRDQPQWALTELQNELSKCERVIDRVVDSHHLGFNHAIENYSKILTLFNECKSQVATLRGNFEEANMRVGAVSSNLRTRWQTSMALQGSISILKDVQAAVTEQTALQQLLARKDWPALVPVLLRLTNKLAIEHLSKLGALSQMRSSLPATHDTVAAALITDILALTFDRPAAMQAPAGGDDSPSTDAARSAVTHHPRIATMLAQEHDVAVLSDTGKCMVSVGARQRGDEEVAKLLACLVQLDCLDLLRERILASAETQIRAAMEKALAAAQPHALSGAPQEPSAGAPRTFVPPAVQARIGMSVLMLLASLLLIHHNTVRLFGAIGEAGPALVTARRLSGRVINALLKGGERAGGARAAGEEREEAVIAEVAARAAADREKVWGALQNEVVGLLACLIRAPFAQTTAAQADAAKTVAQHAEPAQGASNWIGNLLRPEALAAATSTGAKPPSKRSQRVPFKFAATPAADAAGGAAATTHVPTAAAFSDQTSAQVREYKDLVDTMLQRIAPPAPTLVTVVYTPVAHFSADCAEAMGPIAGEARADARLALQTFVDNFAVETLLPRVLADVKTQAVTMLQQKQAFAPSPVAESRNGVFTLQAAHGFEALVTELSGWATAMPLYADELCSIAGTLLSALHDRCDSMFQAAMNAERPISGLLEKPTVQRALEREPVVRFIDAEELFEDPFKEAQAAATDTVLRAVVNTAATPVPEEKTQAERVKVCVMLASIASTLMHMTHAIEAVGRRFTTDSNTNATMADAARTLPMRNDSFRAASRITAISRSATLAADAAAADGDAAARLLPELRGLLHDMNAGSRTQVAAAVQLARVLEQEADVLPIALVQMSKRMRLQAGRCLSAIRLHVMLTLATTISGSLREAKHVYGAEAARERDPAVQSMLRMLHRVNEDLRPFLSPDAMRYIFADVLRSAYRLLIWSVPTVEAINSHGLERLLQWLLLFKGSLSTLTGLDSTVSAQHGIASSASDAALESAQAFLRLLQGPVSNIVMEASQPERRRRLTNTEWLSLLDVNVELRLVTKGQRQQLRDALEMAEDASSVMSSQSTMDHSVSTKARRGPPPRR